MKMKLNKLMMAVAFTLGSVSAVNADEGHGKVTFTGSIVDAPCSIAPESIDQIVELGQISSAALLANAGAGTSKPKNFQINLEGCTMATAKTVTTTFTGAAGKGGRLGVTGDAKGASIAITDGTGNQIELGKPVAPQQIQNGNNTLLFAAYMQGDGVEDDIVPGDFKGVADFSLAYQ